MRWLLMVVGLVVGVLVVRSFFLGPLEELAFRVFAEAVKHIRLDAGDLRALAKTDVVRKFALGGGIGAAAGFALGAAAGTRRKR